MTTEAFSELVQSTLEVAVVSCTISPNGLLYTAHTMGDGLVAYNRESHAWFVYLNDRKANGTLNNCLEALRSY
jgi:hypothetical protein